jgi:hypothetical protein
MNNQLNYEGRIDAFYWNVLAKIFKKLYPEIHFIKGDSKSCS